VTASLVTIAVAAQRSARLFSDVAPWLALFIGVVIAGAILLMVLRRHMQRDQRQPQVGFTLDDLRRLHGSGDLSDEEFNRAKAAMIAGIRAAAGPPADRGGNGPTPPPADA
jgi:hypothetical protein